MQSVQFAVIGLGVGAAYVLVAQGIVLIYRGSGLINFAQGSVALLAAQIYYDLRDSLPTAAAMPVALAVTAAAGFVMQLMMYRLRRASALVRLIATLGVFMLVLGIGRLFWGTSTDVVTNGILPTERVELGGDITIGVDRLILLGFALVVTTALWLAFSRTAFGRATSAVAENEVAATTLGLSPNLVGAVNWVIGSVLAGLAGIAIAPISGLSVTNLSLLIIPGLAAALVGSFTSFWWTLAGGLFLGVMQSELTLHVDTPGWSVSTPFLIIVLLVVARGRALPLRGDFLERPMRAGTGRLHPVFVLACVVAGALVITSVPPDWLLPITSTLVLAIVALSVLLVTGYAGQLSLAQLTIAGVGALAAGNAGDQGWPFWLAVLAGLLTSTLVGVLVGLPALRVRGVNLAVATIGLSLALERLVLSSKGLTGGADGLTVDPPSLLGYDIDFVTYPLRFTLFVFAVFVLCAWMVTNVRRGTTGRRLLALRNDERAAASIGVGVLSSKLYAFALASAVAGVGGAIAAYQFPRVQFTEYTTLDSIMLVVNSVVGGVGYVFGSINAGLSGEGGAAAYALSFLDPDWVNGVAAIGGALVLMVLLTTPDGVFGAWVDATRKIGRRGTRPSWAPTGVARDSEPGQPVVVRNVTVGFGTVVAVDDVSFEVRPGEVLGLIGANGAGKTTLVDAVFGLVPSQGTVSLGDRDLTGHSVRGRAAAGLGRTFQSVDLFDDMTVLDNIRTAAESGDRWCYLRDLLHPRASALPGVAEEAITDLDLAAVLEDQPDTLPSGGRRLVGIARALAGAPTAFFLDEPAAGLSDEETAELGRLIRILAEEWQLPVVLIDHDVSLVASVSDRVLALSLGRVIAEGPPDAVLRDPAVVESYLGAAPAENEPDLEMADGGRK